MTRERSFWFGRSFDAGTRRRETERAEASEQADPPESVSRMETEALTALSASRPTDPRIFPLTRGKVTPPPSREDQIRQEAFDEAVLIARLYEERGANASAVRIALEARARVPLEEAPQPGRATSGVSSSGAWTDGEPSSPLPEGAAPLTSSEERDLWLIARGFDMALRAVGVREPQSLKADAKPKLRVVE